MNETWVKLYRKADINGIMKDHLAWVLFSWLLINVDQKTGKMKLGRYTVAGKLGINPNTYYKVLRRLTMKWKVIDNTVTKEWTEVSIVNWGKYQHNQNTQDKAQATIIQSQDNESNTIQEYKNKEYIYSSQEYLRKMPDNEIEDFNKKYEATKSEIKVLGEKLYLWCDTEGETKKNYRAFIQNRLLDKYGLRKQIVSSVQEVIPEIPEEQRIKNRERILAIKQQFKPRILK